MEVGELDSGRNGIFTAQQHEQQRDINSRIFGVLANLESVQSFMIFGDYLADIVSRK